jgi:hypothetical protein
VQYHGPLLFYHIPEWRLGECDYQMAAHGFLVESGLFDEGPVGEKAAKQVDEHGDQYGMSIKLYWVNQSEDGVYAPPGLILERSILPRGVAAFTWSGISTKELAMPTQTPPAHKIEELRRFFADDPEIVDRLMEGLKEQGDLLEKMGVRFKEALDKTAADAVAGDQPVQGLAPIQQTVEFGEDVLAAIAGRVGEVLPGVVQKETGPLAERLASEVKGLGERLAAIESGLAKLLEADDAKVAEKMAQLPKSALFRATVRPTQRAADGGAGSDAAQDAGQGVSLLKLAQSALHGKDAAG